MKILIWLHPTSSPQAEQGLRSCLARNHQALQFRFLATPLLKTNTKSGVSPFKVIGTDTYPCATYDFLLTFHSSLSYTVFETMISVENHNFSTPVYLTPPLKGCRWNWVPAFGDKKTRMLGLPSG